MDSLPTRRCAAYAQLGITDKEGATICKAMGWGTFTPLSAEQVDDLSYLAERLREWRARNLSLQSFADYYLDELKRSQQWRKNRAATD